MGLFDRWRRPTTRRYEFADRPIVDRPIVVDRDGRADYARRDNSDSWLWLLLIPLFLLLLLGAYTYLGNPDLNQLKTNSENFISRLFNRPTNNTAPSNTTAANNGNNGLRFGVGGAAPTATPTPTPSAQNTGSSKAGSAVERSTMTPTPTSATTRSVQSATDRKIPAVAPATGRGE
jgi:hypothetical protein